MLLQPLRRYRCRKVTSPVFQFALDFSYSNFNQNEMKTTQEDQRLSRSTSNIQLVVVQRAITAWLHCSDVQRWLTLDRVFFSCAWARFGRTQLNRVVCGMGLTRTQRKRRQRKRLAVACVVFSRTCVFAIAVHAIVQDKTITNCSKISSFRCDRIPTRIVRCSLDSLVNADMSIHTCAPCLKTPVASWPFDRFGRNVHPV